MYINLKTEWNNAFCKESKFQKFPSFSRYSIKQLNRINRERLRKPEYIKLLPATFVEKPENFKGGH